jgi:hypothetical protein
MAAPATGIPTTAPSNGTQFVSAVTPGTAFTVLPLNIYVGTGGDVVATFPDGTTATFANVPDGAILPIRPSVITIASTAADMVALY